MDGRRDRCPMEARDCFALSPFGYCHALENTDFGDRPCPFYKTWEENKKGYAAATERLRHYGQEDLIRKYSVKFY